MQWLKEQAHRNRWVAALFDRIYSRRYNRLFTEHLAASVGEAVQWRSREQVLAYLWRTLPGLPHAESGPRRKGSPSRVAISRPDIAVLQDAGANHSRSIGDAEVRAAARVASLDPANLIAFQVYLAIFWLRHERVIESLRRALPGRLIAHISCQPRLDRAQCSVESFASMPPGTAQLSVTGNAAENAFDAARSVLTMSSADNYESLPRKTFEGLALLALACNPACILKLDDDHRLRDAAALHRLMDFAARSQEPLQLGEVNRALLPSAHHRAWHFGKCSTAELNERILAFPAPRRWAAGSSGYILNRPALWRIFWASLYYEVWIDQILYEDLAVAEVALKTGIRIIHAPMQGAIGAVAEY